MYAATPHPLSRSPTPVRVSPPTLTLALDLAPPPESVAKKFRDDVWCSSPPSVTSYIACLYPKTTTSHDIETLLKSPICGFGWRFELLRKLRKIRQKSSPNSQVQVWFVGQTTLFFQSHMCSSMPLKNVTITTKVYYPDVMNSQITTERVFSDVAIRSSTACDIGTYRGLPQYSGRAHFIITVTFDPSDGLSFPNSSCTNTKSVLRRSLDAPSFVDTKFYLFSRNAGGRATYPKILFANSELMKSSGSFLKNCRLIHILNSSTSWLLNVSH